MKKITFILFSLLTYVSFAQLPTNPFTVGQEFTIESTVCFGDGAGACDPANTNVAVTGFATVTAVAGNTVTISDITGGLYPGPYGETGNPGVLTLNYTGQTIVFNDQPDTVYGGDDFDGTGTYTVDGQGNLLSFETTWSNNWGDGGTSTYTIFDNQVPDPVSNPTPADGAVDVTVDTADNNGDGQPDNSVALSWDISQTGGTPTEFDIYFSSDQTFPGGPLGTTGGSQVNITGVDFGSLNYWKIVAKNPAGEAVGSATWSFTTETIGNPPNPVILPTPSDNATNVTVITDDNNGDGQPDNAVELSWLAAPQGSVATNYEVYFGEDQNNLTFLGQTPNTSVAISGNDFDTTYYWQIVAKNSGGAATGSAIWSFTTEQSLSIDDLNAEASLNYFVKNNTLNVSAKSPINQLEIYNMLGQVVKTVQPNQESTNVDLSELNNGMFISKVSVNGKTQTFKFVK